MAAEGVVAAFTAADLAGRLEGRDAVRLAGHRGHEEPAALPADRHARYQGDGVAVVIAESRAHAKDAAELVEVDYEPLDAIVDMGKALEDGAPLVHPDLETNECYVWRLDTDATGQAIDGRRGRRDVPLLPAAADPERDRAARRRSPSPGRRATSRSTPRRRSRTSSALLAAVTLGMRETKLRVVAPDVGGGFGSKLTSTPRSSSRLPSRAGSTGRSSGRRSARRTTSRRSTAATSSPSTRFGATKDGTITACRARVTAAMGAYLQLVTPGMPLLGAWIYAGPVRDPELQGRVQGRVHEHDADRRLPRRRPPRGDLRDRADDGRAGRQARDGSARAPPQELHQGVPGDDRLRPDDRLRRLPRIARHAAREARPRRDPGGAGEAP